MPDDQYDAAAFCVHFEFVFFYNQFAIKFTRTVLSVSKLKKKVERIRRLTERKQSFSIGSL